MSVVNGSVQCKVKYNGFAMFANFIANVFTNPVAAVKVLFYDMAATVLGYISNIAHAIENLINAIPGVQVSITSGLDGLVNNLKSASASVKAESGYKEYFKPMEYKDLTGAFQSGYSAGSNFSFSGLFGGGGSGVSIPSVGSASDLLGDIGKNTGKTAGNTSALKDAVDMTNEDLKMLVDMAERQYVAQVNLTAQSPVINITGQNTGRAFALWRRDRRKHASPNSAQTESAMAGALGVRLAGPASYFGRVLEKPWIGDDTRPIEPQDITRANRMLYVGSALALVLFCGVRLGILALTL